MPTHTCLTPFDYSSASKLNSLCCVDDEQQGRSNPAGSHLLQETLRICSTNGVSLETLPELCYAKSLDQIIRESSAEGNAKPALYELFSLSNSPGSGSKQAPKLQQYIAGDASGGGGIRAAGNTSQSCLQKELSADTDMLGIADNLVTRNSSPGVAPLPSIKDLYASVNSIAAGEVGSRKTELVVPNICEDSAPVIMRAGCLTGKRSTSITSEELRVPEAQPNRGKRLKLNARDSLARGTRTSWSEAESSGRNVDQLFTITSKDLVENGNESGRSLVVFEKMDFSSMDSLKGHKDIMSSHPWIQRLRRIPPEAQSMKPAAEMIYEPRTPIPTLKKRLPSAAAMALMAKASDRIQPCEFKEKRGSVTVWSKRCF